VSGEIISKDQQSYMAVPWNLGDIAHLIFIFITSTLITFLSTFWFKTGYTNFIINVLILIAVFIYFIVFIIVKYKKGLEILLKSRTTFPHRKKIAFFIGVSFGLLCIESMKSRGNLQNLRS